MEFKEFESSEYEIDIPKSVNSDSHSWFWTWGLITLIERILVVGDVQNLTLIGIRIGNIEHLCIEVPLSMFYPHVIGNRLVLPYIRQGETFRILVKGYGKGTMKLTGFQQIPD